VGAHRDVRGTCALREPLGTRGRGGVASGLLRRLEPLRCGVDALAGRNSAGELLARERDGALEAGVLVADILLGLAASVALVLKLSE
jgi:hypothetical protein